MWRLPYVPDLGYTGCRFSCPTLGFRVLGLGLDRSHMIGSHSCSLKQPQDDPPFSRHSKQDEDVQANIRLRNPRTWIVAQITGLHCFKLLLNPIAVAFADYRRQNDWDRVLVLSQFLIGALNPRQRPGHSCSGSRSRCGRIALRDLGSQKVIDHLGAGLSSSGFR